MSTELQRRAAELERHSWDCIRRRIRKILCLLGFHHWLRMDDTPLGLTDTNTRRCERCGKFQRFLWTPIGPVWIDTEEETVDKSQKTP